MPTNPDIFGFHQEEVKQPASDGAIESDAKCVANTACENMFADARPAVQLPAAQDVSPRHGKMQMTTPEDVTKAFSQPPKIEDTSYRLVSVDVIPGPNAIEHTQASRVLGEVQLGATALWVASTTKWASAEMKASTPNFGRLALGSFAARDLYDYAGSAGSSQHTRYGYEVAADGLFAAGWAGAKFVLPLFEGSGYVRAGLVGAGLLALGGGVSRFGLDCVPDSYFEDQNKASK
jgi:hypothetical protein